MRRVPCTPLHTASPRSPRCFCARRLVDISEMRAEDRRQPLENGAIMEFLAHGEFAYKDSDVNSTYGAWWVPLRRMVKELGKEVVERELETMDNDIKNIRSIVIGDAGEALSSDEEEV